jgi:hypothetical protein
LKYFCPHLAIPWKKLDKNRRVTPIISNEKFKEPLAK